MNKWILPLLVSVSALFITTGCTAINNNVTPEHEKQEMRNQAKKVLDEQKMAYMDQNSEKSFVVYGEGIAPQHTISPAQAMALAKRAAITDGYRQLGEKLYGAKISSTETVKDAALKDSRIVSQVNGVIKDTAVTDAVFKDGLYSVRMELTMSGRRWLEIFSY